MDKLIYKILLWMCKKSIKQVEKLSLRTFDQMNQSLDSIRILMDKMVALEETYRANVTLCIKYLPVMLDTSKEIINLANAINNGIGLMSSIQKVVDNNEKHYEKAMYLALTGTSLSSIKKDLEISIHLSQRNYFIAQNKMVNLTHFHTILTLKHHHLVNLIRR